MTRVVVTGLGLVTPLGVGVRSTWANLLANRSGLVSTTLFADYESAGWASVPSKVVGRVPRGSVAEGKWDPADHFAKSDTRRLATFTQYAMAATHEALSDAQYFPRTPQQQRDTGVAVGSGIGLFEDTQANAVAFADGGFKRVQPLFIPRLLSNMAAGNILIRYGLKGVNHSVSSACATGLHAIGDAYNFIKLGYCQAMVCGGTEASVNPLALAGFARAKSVCVDSNDAPSRASRPFDASRNGFVLLEGAGIMVLELLEHATRRQAHIYAEVLGYGLLGDAHHITAPPPDGDGAYRAMAMALARANLSPGDIDYVNAHATSTALGDRAENHAFSRLFTHGPSISLTKGAIGHLLGAAGAVESIFTVKAISDNVVPATLNLDAVGAHPNDDAREFRFDYVPNHSRKRQVRYALNNSFGFGGVNSSICFGRY